MAALNATPVSTILSLMKRSCAMANTEQHMFQHNHELLLISGL